MSASSRPGQLNLLARLGPGILIAATGVGAGDLAGAALAGSKLKLAVLWAVVLGAFLKYVLTEGLARFQLVTGDTLLEGSVRHLRGPVRAWFLIYLLLWSFFVGSALLGACGVTAHAILPLSRAAGFLNLPEATSAWLTPERDKVIYGLAHSLAALVLVLRGGFAFFERVMSVCIGVMFATVVVTAICLRPDLSEVISGLFIPSIPDASGEGVAWTVALMGGVGGTLTILCYGYWIRESGRNSPQDIALCRVDLAAGYVMTGLFGIAMVILGSHLSADGNGSKLLVNLASTLELQLGPLAKNMFLAGAWGAVFSSLLGVWQSVPYVFADFWALRDHRREAIRPDVRTDSWPYRGYLIALSTIPTWGLMTRFETAQKVYAIIGAAFVPMLAGVLLVLNSRRFVPAEYANHRLTEIVLLAAFLLFGYHGALELISRFGN